MISAMDKTSRRTMVEVLEGLHREVRKLALLNDLKIYVLVNGIIGEFVGDEDKVRALIKRLNLRS
jgi:hypothetical protein